ncbi:hypothetical protein GS896_25685 [Rhodococcus hoagii]|nr:hypothetical protein [Prescottella equi]MBM4654102.1 hypothetical protein [Prescottella equi]MBM4719576.1 hypothetical protein [Prescottella equi]NKR23375.1 hypothetical protein [Prescottella equi]NKT56014.1 hypothetical protein [Prescottella equi]
MTTDSSPEPIASVPDTAATVHIFDDSGEAYDLSQCDDTIRSGDVLYVPSENAAAILYLAWPTVLPGYERGEFHGQASHPGFAPWNERGLSALRVHLQAGS